MSEHCEHEPLVLTSPSLFLRPLILLGVFLSVVSSGPASAAGVEATVQGTAEELSLFNPDAMQRAIRDLASRYPDRRIMAISSATNSGLEELQFALQQEVANIRQALAENEEAAEAERVLESRISEDVLASSMSARARRLAQKAGAGNAARPDDVDSDDPDGDDAPEVVFVKE